MDSRTVLLCVVILVLRTQGLVQLRNSLAKSESPLLMKILHSIDSATSDEHLLEVTLKLLKSLCTCMRDTLKAKEDKYISDSNLVEPKEDLSTDGKVLDLYKKIYNNTCFTLKEELTKRNNKSSEVPGHPNCGKDYKSNQNSLSDNGEDSQAVKNALRSKLNHILFKALVLTRHHHKYKIKRYNLYNKSKFKVRNSLKHSLIVILTLHPKSKDIFQKKYNVVEEDLHKILHTNSTIEIDIIDTKYDTKEKGSEEFPKSENFTDCHLQSLYTYLTESEKKNLTKVFRFLRRRDTIKIYIEVITGRNHTDYINICCKNGIMTQSCKKDTIQNIDSDEDDVTQNKQFDQKTSMELHNNYKNTITKIEKLVKKLSDKTLTSGTNSSSINVTDVFCNNTCEKKNNSFIDAPMARHNITDQRNLTTNGIPNLITETNDSLKLKDVSHAIILLNNFVSKQTTKYYSESPETTKTYDILANPSDNQGLVNTPIMEGDTIYETQSDHNRILVKPFNKQTSVVFAGENHKIASTATSITEVLINTTTNYDQDIDTLITNTSNTTPQIKIDNEFILPKDITENISVPKTIPNMNDFFTNTTIVTFDLATTDMDNEVYKSEFTTDVVITNPSADFAEENIQSLTTLTPQVQKASVSLPLNQLISNEATATNNTSDTNNYSTVTLKNNFLLNTTDIIHTKPNEYTGNITSSENITKAELTKGIAQDQVTVTKITNDIHSYTIATMKNNLLLNTTDIIYTKSNEYNSNITSSENITKAEPKKSIASISMIDHSKQSDQSSNEVFPKLDNDLANKYDIKATIIAITTTQPKNTIQNRFDMLTLPEESQFDNDVLQDLTETILDDENYASKTEKNVTTDKGVKNNTTISSHYNIDFNNKTPSSQSHKIDNSSREYTEIGSGLKSETSENMIKTTTVQEAHTLYLTKKYTLSSKINSNVNITPKKAQLNDSKVSNVDGQISSLEPYITNFSTDTYETNISNVLHNSNVTEANTDVTTVYTTEPYFQVKNEDINIKPNEQIISLHNQHLKVGSVPTYLQFNNYTVNVGNESSSSIEKDSILPKPITMASINHANHIKSYHDITTDTSNFINEIKSYEAMGLENTESIHLKTDVLHMFPETYYTSPMSTILPTNSTNISVTNEPLSDLMALYTDSYEEISDTFASDSYITVLPNTNKPGVTSYISNEQMLTTTVNSNLNINDSQFKLTTATDGNTKVSHNIETNEPLTSMEIDQKDIMNNIAAPNNFHKDPSLLKPILKINETFINNSTTFSVTKNEIFTITTSTPLIDWTKRMTPPSDISTQFETTKSYATTINKMHKENIDHIDKAAHGDKPGYLYNTTSTITADIKNQTQYFTSLGLHILPTFELNNSVNDIMTKSLRNITIIPVLQESPNKTVTYTPDSNPFTTRIINTKYAPLSHYMVTKNVDKENSNENSTIPYITDTNNTFNEKYIIKIKPTEKILLVHHQASTTPNINSNVTTSVYQVGLVSPNITAIQSQTLSNRTETFTKEQSYNYTSTTEAISSKPYLSNLTFGDERISLAKNTPTHLKLSYLQNLTTTNMEPINTAMKTYSTVTNEDLKIDTTGYQEYSTVPDQEHTLLDIPKNLNTNVLTKLTEKPNNTKTTKSYYNDPIKSLTATSSTIAISSTPSILTHATLKTDNLLLNKLTTKKQTEDNKAVNIHTYSNVTKPILALDLNMNTATTPNIQTQKTNMSEYNLTYSTSTTKKNKSASTDDIEYDNKADNIQKYTNATKPISPLEFKTNTVTTAGSQTQKKNKYENTLTYSTSTTKNLKPTSIDDIEYINKADNIHNDTNVTKPISPLEFKTNSVTTSNNQTQKENIYENSLTYSTSTIKKLKSASIDDIEYVNKADNINKHINVTKPISPLEFKTNIVTTSNIQTQKKTIYENTLSSTTSTTENLKSVSINNIEYINKADNIHKYTNVSKSISPLEFKTNTVTTSNNQTLKENIYENSLIYSTSTTKKLKSASIDDIEYINKADNINKYIKVTKPISPLEFKTNTITTSNNQTQNNNVYENSLTYSTSTTKKLKSVSTDKMTSMDHLEYVTKLPVESKDSGITFLQTTNYNIDNKISSNLGKLIEAQAIIGNQTQSTTETDLLFSNNNLTNFTTVIPNTKVKIIDYVNSQVVKIPSKPNKSSADEITKKVYVAPTNTLIGQTIITKPITFIKTTPPDYNVQPSSQDKAVTIYKDFNDLSSETASYQNSNIKPVQHNITLLNENLQYVNQVYISNTTNKTVTKIDPLTENTDSKTVVMITDQTVKTFSTEKSVKSTLIPKPEFTNNPKLNDSKTTELDAFQLSIRVGIETDKDGIQFTLLSIDQKPNNISSLMESKYGKATSQYSSNLTNMEATTETYTNNSGHVTESDVVKDDTSEYIDLTRRVNRKQTKKVLRKNKVSKPTIKGLGNIKKHQLEYENVITTPDIKTVSLNPIKNTITILNHEVKTINKYVSLPDVTTKNVTNPHHPNVTIRKTINETAVKATFEDVSTKIPSEHGSIKRKHKKIAIKPASLTDQLTMDNIKVLYQLHVQKLKDKNNISDAVYIDKITSSNSSIKNTNNDSVIENMNVYESAQLNNSITPSLIKVNTNKINSTSETSKNKTFAPETYGSFKSQHKILIDEDDKDFNNSSSLFQADDEETQDSLYGNDIHTESDAEINKRTANKLLRINNATQLGNETVSKSALYSNKNDSNLPSPVHSEEKTTSDNSTSSVETKINEMKRTKKLTINEKGINNNLKATYTPTAQGIAENSTEHHSIKFEITSLPLQYNDKLSNDDFNPDKNEGNDVINTTNSYKNNKISTNNANARNKKREKIKNVIKNKSTIVNVLKKMVKSKKLDMTNLNKTAIIKQLRSKIQQHIEKLNKPHKFHIAKSTMELGDVTKMPTVTAKCLSKKKPCQNQGTQIYGPQLNKPDTKTGHSHPFDDFRRKLNGPNDDLENSLEFFDKTSVTLLSPIEILPVNTSIQYSNHIIDLPQIKQTRDVITTSSYPLRTNALNYMNTRNNLNEKTKFKSSGYQENNNELLLQTITPTQSESRIDPNYFWGVKLDEMNELNNYTSSYKNFNQLKKNITNGIIPVATFEQIGIRDKISKLITFKPEKTIPFTFNQETSQTEFSKRSTNVDTIDINLGKEKTATEKNKPIYKKKKQYITINISIPYFKITDTTKKTKSVLDISSTKSINLDVKSNHSLNANITEDLKMQTTYQPSRQETKHDLTVNSTTQTNPNFNIISNNDNQTEEIIHLLSVDPTGETTINEILKTLAEVQTDLPTSKDANIDSTDTSRAMSDYDEISSILNVASSNPYVRRHVYLSKKLNGSTIQPPKEINASTPGDPYDQLIDEIDLKLTQYYTDPSLIFALPHTMDSNSSVGEMITKEVSSTTIVDNNMKELNTIHNTELSDNQLVFFNSTTNTDRMITESLHDTPKIGPALFSDKPFTKRLRSTSDTTTVSNNHNDFAHTNVHVSKNITDGLTIELQPLRFKSHNYSTVNTKFGEISTENSLPKIEIHSFNDTKKITDFVTKISETNDSVQNLKNGVTQMYDESNNIQTKSTVEPSINYVDNVDMTTNSSLKTNNIFENHITSHSVKSEKGEVEEVLRIHISSNNNSNSRTSFLQKTPVTKSETSLNITDNININGLSSNTYLNIIINTTQNPSLSYTNISYEKSNSIVPVTKSELIDRNLSSNSTSTNNYSSEMITPVYIRNTTSIGMGQIIPTMNLKDFNTNTNNNVQMRNTIYNINATTQYEAGIISNVTMANLTDEDSYENKYNNTLIYKENILIATQEYVPPNISIATNNNDVTNNTLSLETSTLSLIYTENTSSNILRTQTSADNENKFAISPTSLKKEIHNSNKKNYIRNITKDYILTTPLPITYVGTISLPNMKYTNPKIDTTNISKLLSKINTLSSGEKISTTINKTDNGVYFEKGIKSFLNNLNPYMEAELSVKPDHQTDLILPSETKEDDKFNELNSQPHQFSFANLELTTNTVQLVKEENEYNISGSNHDSKIDKNLSYENKSLDINISSESTISYVTKMSNSYETHSNDSYVTHNLVENSVLPTDTETVHEINNAISVNDTMRESSMPELLVPTLMNNATITTTAQNTFSKEVYGSDERYNVLKMDSTTNSNITPEMNNKDSNQHMINNDSLNIVVSNYVTPFSMTHSSIVQDTISTTEIGQKLSITERDTSETRAVTKFKNMRKAIIRSSKKNKTVTVVPKRTSKVRSKTKLVKAAKKPAINKRPLRGSKTKKLLSLSKLGNKTKPLRQNNANLYTNNTNIIIQNDKFNVYDDQLTTMAINAVKTIHINKLNHSNVTKTGNKNNISVLTPPPTDSITSTRNYKSSHDTGKITQTITSESDNASFETNSTPSTIPKFQENLVTDYSSADTTINQVINTPNSISEPDSKYLDIKYLVTEVETKSTSNYFSEGRANMSLINITHPEKDATMFMGVVTDTPTGDTDTLYTTDPFLKDENSSKIEMKENWDSVNNDLNDNISSSLYQSIHEAAPQMQFNNVASISERQPTNTPLLSPPLETVQSDDKEVTEIQNIKKTDIIDLTSSLQTDTKISYPWFDEYTLNSTTIQPSIILNQSSKDITRPIDNITVSTEGTSIANNNYTSHVQIMSLNGTSTNQFVSKIYILDPKSSKTILNRNRPKEKTNSINLRDILNDPLKKVTTENDLKIHIDKQSSNLNNITSNYPIELINTINITEADDNLKIYQTEHTSISDKESKLTKILMLKSNSPNTAIYFPLSHGIQNKQSHKRNTKSIFYLREDDLINQNVSKSGTNNSRTRFVINYQDGKKNISYIHTPDITKLIAMNNNKVFNKVYLTPPGNKSNQSPPNLNKHILVKPTLIMYKDNKDMNNVFTKFVGSSMGRNSVKIYSSRLNRFRGGRKPYGSVTKKIKYNTYQPTTKEDLELISNKVKLQPQPNKSCAVLRTLRHKFPSTMEFIEFLKASNCTVNNNRPIFNNIKKNRIIHLPVKLTSNLRIIANTNKNNRPTTAMKKTMLKKLIFSKEAVSSVENTYLLPVRPVNAVKKPRRIMKRILLGSRRKEIMTMNTHDFFSQHRLVTQGILRKYLKPRPKLAISKPAVTSIPRISVLRPKFDPLETAVARFDRPKPLYPPARDEPDSFGGEYDSHHQPKGMNWKQKINSVQEAVTSLPKQTKLMVNNVIDRPYTRTNTHWNPKVFRDRIDSIRNILYKADLVKATRPASDMSLRRPRPLSRARDLFNPPEFQYNAPKYNYRRSSDGEKPSTKKDDLMLASTRRQRRTIFFLSPTSSYSFENYDSF